MPTRPRDSPHVAPDIRHQMYRHVLWWVADLVATPQPKFPAGSPSHVKKQQVPVEQAPRVLEASTRSLRKENMVGHVAAAHLEM